MISSTMIAMASVLKHLRRGEYRERRRQQKGRRFHA